MIKYDSLHYYLEKKETVFYKRMPNEIEVLVDEEAIELLSQIKEVLNKHKTDYKVVITPNYDKIPSSKKDI